MIAGHLDTVPVERATCRRARTVDGEAALRPRHRRHEGRRRGVAAPRRRRSPSPRATSPGCSTTTRRSTRELNGLGRLAATRPELLAGDFAILGEPSNGVVEGGCQGTLRVDVRTTGARAHSARSWMGRQRHPRRRRRCCAGSRPTSRAQVEIDGLVYREGLNAVRIRGGVAGNVIPDECVVTVNYRFAPSRSAAEAEAHVREVFDGLRRRPSSTPSPVRCPGSRTPRPRRFVAAVGGEPTPEVRLDRRRPLQRARRPGGQLRPRRPVARAPPRRVRARRAPRRRRGAACAPG